MNIPLSDITINTRKRDLRPEKVQQLADSITELGLLNPITLTPDYTLISGLHRLEAVRVLGQRVIAAVVVTLDALHVELAEIDENLMRGELSALERGEQYARRKEIYEALHPETRREATLKQNRNEIISERTTPSFTAATAEAVQVSERSIQQDVQIARNLTAEVREAIRATPLAQEKVELLTLARQTPAQQQEVIEKIQRGESATVKDAVRHIQHEARLEKQHAAPLDTVTATYPIILCDPPWRYEHSISDSRAIENQYPTMTLEEICALPVSTLTGNDCLLFLWATSPKLAEAMQVIATWGFLYRTSMIWVKDKIGMGYYARSQHELLLIAVKGEPSTPLPENRPASVVTAPRLRHSEKPEVFYELIEQMYPSWPKLELFARNTRAGWSSWGNEV